MKVFSQIKGVEVRSEDHDGTKMLAQFMICHECKDELRFSPAGGGSVLPEEFIHKKARQSGWLPKKNGRHLCPKCQKGNEDVADEPREMSISDRRKIFAEILECYDEVNSRYCDNITDNSIAQKLGVPRKWVSDIREENVGPSGENVEMDRLSSNLGKLNAELTDAINDCLDAAAKAEKAREDVDVVRKQLDQIRAAVGPYRAA